MSLCAGTNNNGPTLKIKIYVIRFSIIPYCRISEIAIKSKYKQTSSPIFNICSHMYAKQISYLSSVFYLGTWKSTT